MKTELLYGMHPVREALLAGKRQFLAVYVSESRTGEGKEEILSLARERGIEVKTPDQSFFKGQDRGGQGVAARVSLFKPIALESLVKKAGGEQPLFFLLLDEINDPQNCGALMRTALCAGVHGVIMPDKRSSPLSPAVSKASAGALEHMPVARVVNLVRSMQYLKDQGVWFFGLDARASGTVWEADLTGPAAVVVGNEGKGLRPLVRKECDQLVSIPQAGPLGSLNASVAGALSMYEVMRQRRMSVKSKG
ncbi:23S rRNA (guanosine2251-2'-O)-methyltransferase [Desulfatibacillum alkenivorans DSM 16219]|jgi:23S rRNA (guanosine2251-2'-O)-methyltransferase|uniref:23S rRNA (Guanosine2251-2'-O)-methyltransferase n=1 Tax=Desulfatibacillum alkenivorans DSM 16219 TaxID=1121393 RepID=A0A1M6IKN7_9BACT|nr:23S rRNA (guanosine(2251)-2'-O)-methyltransferase RlmB [Desulfatibacillum alkenivorans]SHJ35036.1 23S rRNA (guanosine2251-2'-O)-methyltransferase [Desulfatibacillum alkenivorans DSM 16219]